MLDMIGSIFSGILSGGATGLLGVLLQRFFDAKKQANDLALVKLQLDAAQRTRELELASQERMAGKAAEVASLQATLDADAKASAGADASYVASLATDKSTWVLPVAQEKSRLVRWVMGLVDGIRGLMRPAITTYTLYLLTVVFIWVRSLYEKTGVVMTAEEAHALTLQAVQTIIYLAVTTVVWWFGVRPAQPPRAVGR